MSRPKSLQRINAVYLPIMVGKSIHDPNYAKKYLKPALNRNMIFHVFDQLMIESGDSYSELLTGFFGEPIFRPLKGMADIFQIELSEELSLFCRIDGFSLDRECVYLVDEYYTFLLPNVETKQCIILMAAMALWRAKRGVFLFRKCNNKVIEMEFDEKVWEDSILYEAKAWARALM